MKRLVTLAMMILACATSAWAQLVIKLNHKLDVRVAQIDWNIINRGDQQTGIVLTPTPFQTVGTPFVIPGMRQDNLRLSVGIVIH